MWRVAKAKCTAADAVAAWEYYSVQHSALLERRRASGDLVCHLDGVHYVDMQSMRQVRADDEGSWRAVVRLGGDDGAEGAALPPPVLSAPASSGDSRITATPQVASTPWDSVATAVGSSPARRLNRDDIMFVARTCQQAGLYEDMAAELEKCVGPPPTPRPADPADLGIHLLPCRPCRSCPAQLRALIVVVSSRDGLH
eukprot:COSAG05_NODE_1884_length_3893_cov_3.355825_8_plen_198_part_00